jgi:hypothetical protein
MGDDRPRRYQKIPLSAWESLRPEYRALMAMCPDDVTITLTDVRNWKIECSYDNGHKSGTATRWVSQWDHTITEWAAAIAQVKSHTGEF